MKILQLIALVLCGGLILGLAGCELGSSPKEQIGASCIKAVNTRLGLLAKYDWDTSHAKAEIMTVVPDKKKNKKYDTGNYFQKALVLVTGFTMKNGFNADVKSSATCLVEVSKEKGKLVASDYMSVDNVSINGKDLGGLGDYVLGQL